MGERLREILITLLDDDEGINESAFKEFSELPYADEYADVLDKVKIVEGRVMLDEDVAEQLRENKE